MSKRVICFVMLAALLMAGQAMAADRFSGNTGAYNWNGFYAGVNLGGGWTSNSVTVHNAHGAFDFGAPGLDTSGVIGGGQFGFNYQCGCWLLGIEADFQGADLSETVTAVDRFTSTVGSFEQSLEWFGTVRARAGWVAMPCLLIYGTGGFAYGEVENSATLGTRAVPVIFETSSSSVQTGWTVGGGVEWALSRCWSVKAEYLFMDLGSRSFDIGTPAVARLDIDHDVNIARVGVNFKFW